MSIFGMNACICMELGDLLYCQHNFPFTRGESLGTCMVDTVLRTDIHFHILVILHIYTNLQKVISNHWTGLWARLLEWNDGLDYWIII